jgi:hypothetical protein
VEESSNNSYGQLQKFSKHNFLQQKCISKEKKIKKKKKIGNAFY